jgi:myo-inositol 2-dehydrogenase / D-chiro-inositol 1-dehydrogenase
MKLTRRSVLAGPVLASPAAAFTYQANSAPEIGIVGCGGRGNYVGGFFIEYTGARVKALADPFEERMGATAQKLGQASAERFGGLDGYKRLLEQKLDAVLLMSPPCFHPEQAMEAVKAGKHVYSAKPVAVDVPGCRLFTEAGERAAKAKLSFWVDFQTRSSEVYQEAARRVHGGAIGEAVLGHVYYHASRLSPKDTPQMSAQQARLANWVFDKALSGDIIVEQNIHVVDAANWFLKAHPVKAMGTCGRKARVDVGDCNDHFLVTFWYPDGVKVDFSSAQFTKGYDDLCVRVYGSMGTVDSHYGGAVKITGDAPWTGAEKDNTGKNGAVANVKAFAESIRAGAPVNNAAVSVESNLSVILGRMAAYGERQVTWEEMLSRAEKVDLKLG